MVILNRLMFGRPYAKLEQHLDHIRASAQKAVHAPNGSDTAGARTVSARKLLSQNVLLAMNMAFSLTRRLQVEYTSAHHGKAAVAFLTIAPQDGTRQAAIHGPNLPSQKQPVLSPQSTHGRKRVSTSRTR